MNIHRKSLANTGDSVPRLQSGSLVFSNLRATGGAVANVRFSGCSVDASTVIAPSSETFSVAGGAAADASPSVGVSVISVTGTGDAAGALGPGTAVGARKLVTVAACAGGTTYQLTIGAYTNAAGATGTWTVAFTGPGQSLDLVWTGAAWSRTTGATNL